MPKSASQETQTVVPSWKEWFSRGHLGSKSENIDLIQRCIWSIRIKRKCINLLKPEKEFEENYKQKFGASIQRKETRKQRKQDYAITDQVNGWVVSRTELYNPSSFSYYCQEAQSQICYLMTVALLAVITTQSYALFPLEA